MWKHVASNALTLLIVGLVAVGGVIAWARASYETAGPLTEAICVQVESGSNMRRVSQNLAERGAIDHPQIMRIGANYTDRSNLLKAGSFLVEEGASMREIVDIVTGDGQSTCGTEIVYRIGVTGQELRVRELDPTTNQFDVVAQFDPVAEEDTPEIYAELRGQPDTRYRIAVAEGVTSWQVVAALNAADFMADEIPAVPQEGVLAPDSYEVREGASRVDLLARMQEAQSLRLAQAWEGRDADLPYDTPEEALIMASIVEKETGVPDERRQVASVFVNRLNSGMRLQTDPTVIYGITNGEGVLGRGLRRSELQASTAYNTYTIDGLPPTPIANPGFESIQAALDPDETDFLFFVADGSGGHAFARTLSEHNENVARWRTIEAERASEAETSN
ncbi:endolytic transglycosylase MltG [Palleronia sp. LCG004]|uniref:endolytic transglycosylase MltG n=1 Tax=Palleronia sp. LCG004 TaxID=3079304 RepID=UPI0029430BBE|nr:endolytic transglycosylase MltG [Palleronia sp. LCG004]WOI55020.1 endolytic transglycosylase MltG [Palleronia sp. LCG004]